MKTFTLVLLLSALALTVHSTNAIRLPSFAHGLRQLNSDITTDATPDLGTTLKVLLQSFKKLMPCGADNLGLPILAPFSVEKFNFNLSNTDYILRGQINNLEVTDMSNFRILKLDMADQFLAFDIYFPSLQVLGEYNFYAWAKLAGFPFSTAGNGIIDMKVNGFRMVGGFQVAPPASGSGLQLSELKFQYFISNLESNNWNNLADNIVNNFFNHFYDQLTKVGVEETQEIVQNFIAQQYLPLLNNLLENVDMSKLINILMDTTSAYEAAATC